MSNIFTAAEQLIGHTPLLRLVRLEAAHNLNCHLLAKLESFNPGGSAKDRVAKAMLDDAEDRGLIGPGATIIEPTSGNTGIGLAAVCAQRGYRCIIVMPDSMSLERQKLMTAYGAELVLTPGSGGMLASITRARALAASIPGAWIPDQFANPANASAHYMTTGPEIWNDCDGEVDLFVAGVGNLMCQLNQFSCVGGVVAHHILHQRHQFLHGSVVVVMMVMIMVVMMLMVMVMEMMIVHSKNAPFFCCNFCGFVTIP